MSIRFVIAFALFLVCSPGSTVLAQEKSKLPKPDPVRKVDSPLSEKTLKQKHIQAELDKGEPLESWEGDFFNLGFNGPQQGWLISRKAGYVSTSRWFDTGTVEVKGTRIVLKSTTGDTWAADWPVYEVVKWGERVYLVPPSNLFDFCNDANDGTLLIGSRFMTMYLSSEDNREKKVSGVPVVPAEYKSYLLDKPVAGKVKAVGGRKEEMAIRGRTSLISGTEVTLDVGKNDKIHTGMRFYPEGNDDRGRHGFVIAVTATECVLLVETLYEDKQPPLQTGRRWTTSNPFHSKR